MDIRGFEWKKGVPVPTVRVNVDHDLDRGVVILKLYPRGKKADPLMVELRSGIMPDFQQRFADIADWQKKSPNERMMTKILKKPAKPPKADN